MTNSKPSPRWVLGLTAVASFMVALDALVVSTALTTMRTDLGASIGQPSAQRRPPARSLPTSTG